MVAAVAIGGSIISGYASSSSARSASRAQQRSADAATAEQARQFDVAQEAQRPYREVGMAALNQLAALYGLPQFASSGPQPLSFEQWLAQHGETVGQGGGSQWADAIGPQSRDTMLRAQYQQYLKSPPPTTQASAPSFENFFASPDYQFALRQGEQTVQNSAAATGGLYSGNALRALSDYGQGAATQHLNNYANRLASIAGVGQTAATQTGQNAMTYGNNVSNLLVGSGNARASGIINQGNAWANAANQIGMYFGYGGGYNPYAAPGYGTPYNGVPA